jgi:hypothetical protein
MQANQSDGPNCGIALLNSVIVMHTQRRPSPPLERGLSACDQPMPCHVCPLRYIWFSQTSTGEKKLAGGVSPFGQGQRGAWTKAPPTRTLYRWAALTNLR